MSFLLSVIILSVIILSVIMLFGISAEFHYLEYCYAE